MFDEINRHAMFHEMHRAIEESATDVAQKLTHGQAETCYPPNGGFSTEELAALKSIPRSGAMESALRKVIADAAAYPVFHLFCLIDGVCDTPQIEDIQECDQTAVDILLHDGLYDSYWAWRRRRPNPGWRLDNYDGE